MRLMQGWAAERLHCPGYGLIDLAGCDEMATFGGVQISLGKESV